MNKQVLALSRERAATSAGAPDFAEIYATIAAGSAARDAAREHPWEALAALREARFGALRLPAAEGGFGATLRDVIAEVVLLAEADSNVAHIYRNHFVVGERLLTAGPDAVQASWRPLVRKGGIIGLATTELDRPQTGGLVPLRTRLVPDGNGFRLDGTKFYSTGSLYADLIYVRANGPDGEWLSILVLAQRDGVELVGDWDGIGQRVTGSGATHLRQVRVNAAEVVPDAALPPCSTAYGSTVAQLYVTGVNAGILRAVLRDAKALLLGRTRNFYYAPNPVPAEDPLLQQPIGLISADAFAAETVVLRAAEALDRVLAARDAGEDPNVPVHDAALAAAKAKLVVDDLVLRSANRLFGVGGATVATRLRNLDRHWRNARTLASHNPGPVKAQLLGAFELNGTRLPGLGFF